MRLTIESHLFAETILEGEFRNEWDELLQVLGNVDPPLRAPGPFTPTGRPPTPKRQRRRIGGQNRWAMFPVDQAALNLEINDQLIQLGWTRQTYVLGHPAGTPVDSYLKGDFEKSGVFVEVEFGNAASLFRDLFKFQVAGRSGVGKVGVLVVCREPVARFFDQGVATYEQALSLLPYMNIGLALPTVIVGLDVNDWTAIAARYAEMQAVAGANGLDCHGFEQVQGARGTIVAPLELGLDPGDQA